MRTALFWVISQRVVVLQCKYNLQMLLRATKHNLAGRVYGIHVLIPPTMNPHNNINKSHISLQVRLKRQSRLGGFYVCL
jgi:hypothetical protein